MLAIMGNSHHGGRRGKVAIPEIVMHTLEMPDAFAGCGIQRDKRIGEEIVADAIATVKIEDGRTSGTYTMPRF